MFFFAPHPLLRPARIELDEDFIGAEIEILYSYEEPDGSTTKMWCQGEVVAVRTKYRVHIEWDASTLREGDEPITRGEHPKILEDTPTVWPSTVILNGRARYLL